MVTLLFGFGHDWLFPFGQAQLLQDIRFRARRSGPGIRGEEINLEMLALLDGLPSVTACIGPLPINRDQPA
jgi:hypothetical protein